MLLEFQRTHPDTLIVVTADHGHATQIVRAGEAKAYGTLQTADGSPIRVGYSTSTSGQWHTGTQVPIAAKGPQAANLLGTLDQTELYQVLKGLAPAGTDVEAPVTTATVAPAANANGWHTTVPVTITLSRHGRDLGVASTEFRLNGGAWTAYTAPIAGGRGGATTSVEFRSTDSAGNVETIRSQAVKIDSTAPTATVALNRPRRAPVATYSHTGPGDADGRDAGGSGIDKVEYRFGTGAWSTYAGPFTVYTNGEHAIEYRPVDVAGNVGTAATVRFTTAGLSGTPASCVASSSDEFDGSRGRSQVERAAADRVALLGDGRQAADPLRRHQQRPQRHHRLGDERVPAAGADRRSVDGDDEARHDRRQDAEQPGRVRALAGRGQRGQPLRQGRGQRPHDRRQRAFAPVLVGGASGHASTARRAGSATATPATSRARCRTPCSCAWSPAAARCRRSAPTTRSTASRGRSS